MANLGAIASGCASTYGVVPSTMGSGARPSPACSSMGSPLQAGVLKGRLTYASAAPVAYTRVQLQDGRGNMVQSSYSDANGYYRFTGLNPLYMDYSIVAPDPTNVYNLGRLDNMTPIVE
jgi:hypothetical protein